MFKSRLAALGIAALLGVAIALVSPGFASAANKNVGDGRGQEFRCFDLEAPLCLYYSTWDTAMFATDHNIPNLSGYLFYALPPSKPNGHLQPVRNNAATMSCGNVIRCDSYFHVNYTGNWDYLWRYSTGTLWYTWNDEASVKIWF